MQDHPFSIILSLLKRIPCLIRIANHPVGSLKYFNNFLIYKLKLLIKIFFYNFATLIVCNSKQSTSFFKESLSCATKNLSDALTKEELLKQLNQNIISCKDVSFRIFGLSLAAINTIFSILLTVIFMKLFLNYGKN